MRNIYYWHGETIKLRDELLEVNGVEWKDVNSGTSLVYNGTLDEFEKSYGRNFQVMKDGTIAVTQHNSWGMR